MFDADGRLLVWNEHYIELYGMSHDIVRSGADINDIVAHRKQPGVLTSTSKPMSANFGKTCNGRQEHQRHAPQERTDDLGHQYRDLGRRMDRDPRRHHRARRG